MMIRLQVLLVSPSSLDVPLLPRSYLSPANFSQYQLNPPRIAPVNDFNPNSSELSFQASMVTSRILANELQQQRIANSRSTRKFLHFTDENNTLQDLCDEIVSKIAKMYPSIRDQVEIDTLQDTSGCDLDPDFIVGEIFTFDNIVRVILKRDIDWTEVGPVSKYGGLKRRKLGTESEQVPGSNAQHAKVNEENGVNNICFDSNINSQRRKSMPARRSSLRMSTTLSNQIYPNQSKNSEGSNLDANDRSFLPPPAQPQSPSIRISSGIESHKRILSPNENDIVSRSETVDPDKSRQQPFMDMGPQSNSSGMPILTGQHVTNTPGTNNLSFFQDVGLDTPHQPLQTPAVSAGTLRLPEAKLSKTQRQSVDDADADTSSRSTTLKVPEPNISANKTPQGNITSEPVSEGVTGHQLSSPSTRCSPNLDTYKSSVTTRNGGQGNKIKQPLHITHRQQTSIADNNGSPVYNNMENDTQQVRLAELPELKRPLSSTKRNSTTIESTIRASISQQRKRRLSIIQTSEDGEKPETINSSPSQSERYNSTVKGKTVEVPTAREGQATPEVNNDKFRTEVTTNTGETAKVSNEMTKRKTTNQDTDTASPRTNPSSISGYQLPSRDAYSSQVTTNAQAANHNGLIVTKAGVGKSAEEKSPKKSGDSIREDNIGQISTLKAEKVSKISNSRTGKKTESKRNSLLSGRELTPTVTITEHKTAKEEQPNAQFKRTEKNVNSTMAKTGNTIQTAKNNAAQSTPFHLKKSELIDMLEDSNLDIFSWFLDKNDDTHHSRRFSRKKPYTTVLHKDIDNSKPDPRNILPEKTKRSAAKRAVKKMTDHSIVHTGDVTSDESSDFENDTLELESTDSSDNTEIESSLLYDNGIILREINGLSDLYPSKGNDKTVEKPSIGKKASSVRKTVSDNTSERAAEKKNLPANKKQAKSPTVSMLTAASGKEDTNSEKKPDTNVRSSVTNSTDSTPSDNVSQSHHESAAETDPVEDSSSSENDYSENTMSLSTSRHNNTKWDTSSGSTPLASQKGTLRTENTTSGEIPLTQMLGSLPIFGNSKTVKQASARGRKPPENSQPSTSANKSIAVNKTPQSNPDSATAAKPPQARRRQVNTGKSRPAGEKKATLSG